MALSFDPCGLSFYCGTVFFVSYVCACSQFYLFFSCLLCLLVCLIIFFPFFSFPFFLLFEYLYTYIYLSCLYKEIRSIYIYIMKKDRLLSDIIFVNHNRPFNVLFCGILLNLHLGRWVTIILLDIISPVESVTKLFISNNIKQ